MWLKLRPKRHRYPAVQWRCKTCGNWLFTQHSVCYHPYYPMFVPEEMTQGQMLASWPKPYFRLGDEEKRELE